MGCDRILGEQTTKDGFMEWMHVFTILAGNMALMGIAIGLFLWSRAESRSDMRMMMGIINSIKDEIKDFHGRLCAIEERNRK